MSKFSCSARDVPDGDARPSLDSSRRHALDALLRAHGFAVAARPRRGPTRWEKGGRTYSEAEALRTVPRDEVERAKAAHDGYLESKYH